MSRDQQLQVVEIGGTKVAVDLALVTRMDAFVVGSKVKVLKKGYGESEWKSYPGVIVGFDPFPSRPTIVICYLDASWSEASIKFAFLHKESKDLEIAPMLREEFELDRADIVKRLDSEIAKKQIELDELNRRKSYFLEQFGKAFALDAEAV